MHTLSLLCLHWALPGNGSSASMFSGFCPRWLVSISQFTTTHKPVFSVTLLPMVDVPLLLGSCPCMLATISCLPHTLIADCRLSTDNCSLGSSYIASAQTQQKTPFIAVLLCCMMSPHLQRHCLPGRCITMDSCLVVL
jgi:hypothetical protein